MAILKEAEATSLRIIAKLEKTKSKYVTAAFYLNSVAPNSDCPEVIGAIFDEGGNERRGNREGNISRGDLIPLYIRSLENMTNTSKNHVYDVQLLRDNIVVKTGYRPNYAVEYAIGYYFINSLRAEIPNFVQTYEKFTCGTSDGVCGRGEKSEFLALEKIRGVTFAKYVKNLTYSDTCLLLLQVYLSLIVANKRFGFCHYDLHGENVLVYETEPVAITYDIGSGESSNDRESSSSSASSSNSPTASPITVVTPFVAVIIDFGTSRVAYEGEEMNAAPGYPTRTGNKSYIDFYFFLEDCISDSGSDDPEKTSKLKYLLSMLPNGYRVQAYVGTGFAGKIIQTLLTDCSKYSAVKVYTPTTCGKRTRITPVTSTLDYYESYPFSKDRDADVDSILDLAIVQLKKERKASIFITYCKLYVFFYERHYVTKMDHKVWYDKCLNYLQQIDPARRGSEEVSRE